jgi:uncharacterized protein
MNRLGGEQSPYLLQHAHNPVDWFPWGPEAFDKARRENKPIFLSIGYSTCHWCHVMERESFESDRIAELLNRDFVSIKVDREERPDVDRIYMTFVQATTGGGGWPMSVFLTPELEPFFGGTYFPPENRYGHPGFASILTQLAEAWRTQRSEIAASAREMVDELQKRVAVQPGTAASVNESVMDSGFFGFRRAFDAQTGGFGAAPKFPRPSVIEFLLRYHARTKNTDALEMSLLTLREMAKGGMHDQLGGGFHRYSVDERWFVPHFEKMLYDQGQLAISYLEAFQLTGEKTYADVARDIFDYVLRDMTSPEGGFYSAEDADSVIDPEDPKVKGEGAFYIWTADEIHDVVPSPAADWFMHRYGVADGGNVANDPHNEFTNRNILYEAVTVADTALFFRQIEETVAEGIAEASRLLLEARSKRIRPGLDDKILTAWNGLMISAFALGGAVLDEPRYQEAAKRAANFLIEKMYNASSGKLLRRYRQGDAAIDGFLDDYAMFTQALLDLYETQFDIRHLEIAARLTEKQRELFEDKENGGFFNTAGGGPAPAAKPSMIILTGYDAPPARPASTSELILRMKDDYDGAEPAGNSVALMNLLRLGHMTDRQEFRDSADRLLAAFAPYLAQVPVALPYMLAACEFRLSGVRQVVLAGEDLDRLARAVWQKFVPNKVVLGVNSPAARQRLAGWIPAIEDMREVDNRAAAYVCRNYTCQLPVTGVDELLQLLQ